MREHGKWLVCKGLDRVPSIPITEIWEGYVRLEWAGSTEQVAPISTRKLMALAATSIETWGSARMMGVSISKPH